ncbi:hypothetical protein [Devosia sp.]|uniref:hypothetical protein n=1 Tax=Devosia sp. TaxID=1871048 RepID=UPI002FCC700D
MGAANNNGTDQPDDATQQKSMAAWGQWATAHQTSIVENGAPLGNTLKADQNGVSSTTNLITGYLVVEAESHEQAAAIFKNHPHFAVFSGSNSVEIIEILEMPANLSSADAGS